MFVICGRCKNVVNRKDIDKGKFVLKRELGEAYVPEYNCNDCLNIKKEKMLYILENAYPVLTDNLIK